VPSFFAIIVKESWINCVFYGVVVNLQRVL
jgi:hypothetical protein